jgi:hypothetical protein
MTDKQSPFSRLDTSLLRSTSTPASAGEESKKPGNEEIKISREEEIKKSRNQEKKKNKRTDYQKVNYRLSPEALEHLEDIVIALKRTYGVKALREEVVEEAIEAVYRELQEQKEHSSLVQILSRNQEVKKS